MAIARPVDRRLFFLLDRVHTQLVKSADLHLAPASRVSTSQAAVLIYLGYHDHCRLSELADGVGRNNSAVTGLVSRMEASGLIARSDDHHDRRAKTVHLTPEGWARRETVMDDFRDFNAHLVKGLTATEIDAVFKFLSRAVDNVSSA